MYPDSDDPIVSNHYEVLTGATRYVVKRTLLGKTQLVLYVQKARYVEKLHTTACLETFFVRATPTDLAWLVQKEIITLKDEVNES